MLLIFQKKKLQVFRLKSSIQLIKYLLLLLGMGVIGPHMSACISWRIWDALHVLSLGNESLCCFPIKQPSHTFEGALRTGNPCTMSFPSSVFSPRKLRCPYRQCHVLAGSSVIALKQDCFFGRDWTNRVNIIFDVIEVSTINALSGW